MPYPAPNSRLFVRQVQWDANKHIALNHLRTGLATKPVQTTGMVDTLFAMKYMSVTPLSSILRLAGSVQRKTIPGYYFTWESKQDTLRLATLLKASWTGSYPGANRTTITLTFDKNMFDIQDIIGPGVIDASNMIYLTSQGIKDGEGWTYTGVVYSDLETDFVETRFLQPGSRWNKMFTNVGEGTDGGSAYISGAKVQFKNSMTMLRKEYTVTGPAFDNNKTVDEIIFVDENGNSYTSFLLAVEREYWKQFAQEEYEAALWFSKKVDKLYDKDGQPVFSGSGLLEQVQDSYTMNYNILTADLLESFISEALYNKVKPEERKNTILYMFTGIVGMKAFNKAAEELAAKNNTIIANADFSPIQRTTSDYHQNSYSVGYQYTEIKLFNGINLRVVHNPIFDDPRFTRDIDPLTNRPVSSGYFVIFDISYGRADNNITIIEPEQPLAIGYKIGLIGPDGRVNYGNVAHTGDYYKVAMQRVVGLQVSDPTRIAWLKPSHV